MVGNSTIVIAQKCKFDIEEKDDFSGKTTIGFRYRLKSPKNYNSITYFLMKDGDEYLIKVDAVLEGAFEKVINPDESILELRLENKEIIKGVSRDKVAPKYLVGDRVLTTYTVYYNVGKEFYEKLSNSSPMAIRLSKVSSIDYSEEIKDKWKEKMKEEAKCLLEN